MPTGRIHRRASENKLACRTQERDVQHSFYDCLHLHVLVQLRVEDKKFDCLSDGIVWDAGVRIDMISWK